jgi:pilus assembly protein Flp/PilA
MEGEAMGLIQRFYVRLRSEEGATAVEYALMVALIAVVIIVAVTFLGVATSDKFQQVGDAVAST